MVSGVLLGIATAALVAGTGLVIAVMLRLPDFSRLLLGTYVVAFAEIVVVVLLLSALDALTRAALLVLVSFLFGASFVLWFISGRPQAPSAAFGRARDLRSAPLVVVLAAVTGLALLYVFALIVGTPPTNHDSLTYHLTRVAFWMQEGGVHYIPDAYDARMNAHPPNAELALTFVLEVGRNERLAGFVQYAAALALAVGVYALARHLRLPVREAVLGALFFLTLPIVLLEASTAQNDLVAASFLVAATLFLLGDSRRELAVAALATALAVGTKVPAAYGVFILAGVAFVAPPATLRLGRFVAIATGALAGSYWYLVNLVQTGSPLGDISGKAKLVAILDPTENFLGAYARLIDAFDLSGAIDGDILLYAIAAAVVAIAYVLRPRRSRRESLSPALVTGALVVIPITFVPVGYVLWHGFAKLHDVLEASDGFLPVKEWGARTISSDTISWYGPLGLLLAVGVGVAVLILVRRRLLSPVALVFAAAPLAWFLLFAVTLAYDPTQGRFFMYPVAVSAALWGLVLRVERYAVAAVAIAVVSATLSLVSFYEKPSGIRLIDQDPDSFVDITYLPHFRSAWGLDRWEAQSLAQRDALFPLRFIAQIPPEATVALALGFNDFGYPAFGGTLDRRVELVPFGSGGRTSEAEWLLANPKRAPAIDRACWRAVHTTPERWVGFRRRAGACGG